ncbi:MAG: formylglycine-generating enzyme family protein [Prolixibacteraceae bacterium]|jgi:formylglycine-generating enzyme required for sulfatase activity|nr:formylglycine-generating enzyme family protein [Prolixibacteraceae bacterium]
MKQALVFLFIILIFTFCKQQEQTVANYYEPVFDQTGKQILQVNLPATSSLDSTVLIRSNLRDTRYYFSDTIIITEEFYFDYAELIVPVELINAKPPTFDTFLIAREYLYSHEFADILFPVIPDSIRLLLADSLYANTQLSQSHTDTHTQHSDSVFYEGFYTYNEIVSDTTRDLFMADSILKMQTELAPWKIYDSIPYFNNMENVFVDSTLKLLLDTVYVEVFDSSKIIPQMPFDVMCDEFSDTISRDDIILWENEVVFRIFYPDDIDVFVEMVRVKGGTFKIGSDFYDYDERPATNLRITGFLLGKYEITNEVFCYFLNDMKCDSLGNIDGIKVIDLYHPLTKTRRNNFTGDFTPVKGWEDHPVVNVSWVGAQMFCKMGGGRLPSEAEWEYAARGGQYARKYPTNRDKSDFEYDYLYAGGNYMGELGWFVDNSRGMVWKGGLQKPNELGLHDMSGNVWEWCYDKYRSDFYARNGDSTDPMCLVSDKVNTRVNRGGSWSSDATYCRVANRNYLNQFELNPYLGFRIMRPLK